MPTRRATWLPLAAVVANGLLVGASLDQSIKQLPARHRIGVTVVAADFVLQPRGRAGADPVVADRLAGAPARTVLGVDAAAGGGGGPAGRRCRRAGAGVGPLRGGAMAAFAHGDEEPTLCRRFGAEYEAYRRAVPAWWPRRHPWQPGQASRPARHER